MYSEETIVERLTQKGVKATANRILVMRELARIGRPVSLSDLEKTMPTMDKSSIFRVLTLFLRHDIVHAFEDGRGMVDYELCGREGPCDHNDAHFHFFCENCGRTFCLDHLHVADISLPEGFVPSAVSLVIKGRCADCSRRRQR